MKAFIYLCSNISLSTLVDKTGRQIMVKHLQKLQAIKIFVKIQVAG